MRHLVEKLMLCIWLAHSTPAEASRMTGLLQSSSRMYEFTAIVCSSEYSSNFFKRKSMKLNFDDFGRFLKMNESYGTCYLITIAAPLGLVFQYKLYTPKGIFRMIPMGDVYGDKLYWLCGEC